VAGSTLDHKEGDNLGETFSLESGEQPEKELRAGAYQQDYPESFALGKSDRFSDHSTSS
jgi:hypothetical protein